MKRLPPNLQWQTRAACEGADPDIFFGSGIKKALEYCNSCPVQIDCLEYAITEKIHDGIWGGKTPQQRQGKRLKWGRPNGPIAHGTHRGYAAHHYRGEKPCDACREANNAYAKTLRDKHSTNQKRKTP